MIVVTGGTGRLGRALQKVFPQARFPRRDELDVNSRDSVIEYLQNKPPEVVIHAAAMTDVRSAQVNQRQCWETNVRGTERLVDALNLIAPSCYFVYVSTPCVFQGDRGDYTEDDFPDPKNFYGLTKLVGEYVAQRMGTHLILRSNFVAREPWPFQRAFVDRFGTYLFADDVAQSIEKFVAMRQLGLVHLAGDKRLSMFELARITTPDVEELTMADVNLPLTVDMSLRSVRVPAIKITGG